MDRNTLAIAGRFLSAKTSFPVLSGVYLKVENGIETVYATDLTSFVIVKQSSDLDDMVTVVPYQTLSKLFNSRPEGIKLTQENDVLKLKQERWKSEVKCYNPSDYPQMPEITDGVSLEYETLKRLASLAKYVRKDSSISPVLNCVFIDNQRAVATDGYRLGLYNDCGFDNSLIPSDLLTKAFPLFDADDTLSIHFSSNFVAISSDNLIVGSQLIIGDYPDYKAIIPQSKNGRIVVNKDELKVAVKTATVLTGDSMVVVLGLDDSGLTIKANEIGIGETEEKVNSTDSDADSRFERIGVNASYLLDFLSLADNEVEIEWRTKSDPIKFNSAGHVCIIMPMHIQ